MINEKATINRVDAREGETTVLSENSSSILTTSVLTERKETMTTATLDIKVIKVHRIENGRIKGFADISVNDALLIKGIRIVEAKKGLFVSFPTEQGKNERWYERIRCLNNDVRAEITNVVLAAYKDQ